MHPFNYQAISPIPTQISDTTLTKTDQLAYCSFSIADYYFRTSPGCGFVEAFRIGINSDNQVTKKAHEINHRLSGIF